MAPAFSTSSAMCATESCPSTTIVSKHLPKAASVRKTYLPYQDGSTHIGPSSSIIGKLCKNCGGRLLGWRHNPKTDDYRHKGEEMDTTEDTFCQWEVFCAEDVKGGYRNHRNPGEKGSLPALGGIGGIIDYNKRLY
jgi:hypothetical protein